MPCRAWQGPLRARSAQEKDGCTGHWAVARRHRPDLGPAPPPPAQPCRSSCWEGFWWGASREQRRGCMAVIRQSGCCETGEGLPRGLPGSLPGRAGTKTIALYPHASLRASWQSSGRPVMGRAPASPPGGAGRNQHSHPHPRPPPPSSLGHTCSGCSGPGQSPPPSLHWAASGAGAWEGGQKPASQ